MFDVPECGLAPLTTGPFRDRIAHAMLGGLTGATVLTIVGVPALYAAVMRVRAAAIVGPAGGG